MRKRFPFLVGGIIALAVALALSGVFAWRWGGIANTWRYLQGYSYVVYPTTIDVGEGERGEKRATSVRVRNLSFSPIRIAGVITTCNCLTPEGLPLIVPPGCVQDLQFGIYLESATGAVEQMAILLIDDGKMQRAPVAITGKCTPKRRGNN